MFHTITDFLFSILWMEMSILLFLFSQTRGRAQSLPHFLRQRRILLTLLFPWILTLFWLENPVRTFRLRFPWHYVTCHWLCSIGLAALAVWTALQGNKDGSEWTLLILYWMLLLHLLVSMREDDGGGHDQNDDIPPSDDPTTPTANAAQRWLREQSLAGCDAKEEGEVFTRETR